MQELLAMLLLVVSAAGGGDRGRFEPAQSTVHRCLSPEGAIQYQDRACPVGQADPAWDATGFAARSSTPTDGEARRAQARQAAWERKARARWEAASRRRLAESLGGMAATRAAAGRGTATTRRVEQAPGEACRKAREAREQAYARDWMALDFDQRGRLDAAIRDSCDDSSR